MQGNSLSRTAYGTIPPFRFCQDAPGIFNGVLLASGPTVPVAGIAQEWTDSIMGTQQQVNLIPQGFPAAASGETVRLYEPVDQHTMIMVGSGQTVLSNAFLCSDASGCAVPIVLGGSNVKWCGAQAIEGGVAGNPIRCRSLNFPVPNAV